VEVRENMELIPLSTVIHFVLVFHVRRTHSVAQVHYVCGSVVRQYPEFFIWCEKLLFKFTGSALVRDCIILLLSRSLSIDSFCRIDKDVLSLSSNSLD
jgi:hypothetical protein